MNRFSKSLMFGIAGSVLLIAQPARAQFTASIKTNTINGVHSNWVGNGSYIVGSNTFKDVLRVINSGVLSNGAAYIGYETSGSNNVAIVTGAGSVWSNGNDLYVGLDGAGNTLTITNGGTVFSDDGVLRSSNNMVTVTGTGSVWSNLGVVSVGDAGVRNTLMITNGGAVFDLAGYIGYAPGGSNHEVTVTGTGSVWSNRNNLDLGEYATSNTLTIANGGVVFNNDCYLGFFGSSNAVSVTGPGSVWNNGGNLYVGFLGTNNVLTINSGSVVASNAFVGYYPDSVYNFIKVNSGSLFVTNAMGNGALVVSQTGGAGSLIINGGSVTADELIATNGANSIISFNGGTLTAGSAFIDNGQDFIIGSTSSNATYIAAGGTHFFNNNFVVRRGALLLNSGTMTVNQLLLTNGANSAITFGGGGLNSAGTFVTNNQQFVVGNGATGANFHLLGGIHSFHDGLRIPNAAVLTGCGTVTGDVTIDSGGWVFTDCGTLTFTGTVTNNYALGVDGGVLEFYGPVVNNGAILLYNGGTTNFHGSFVNNGVVLDAGWVHVSVITNAGNDVIIEVPSASGFGYQLQVSPSLDTPVWTNSGAAQSGTGGVLTFTDPGGATNSPGRFYQVDVFWPPE
ncbi:MAG TPA: hypothetical protein VMV72_08300 [Verrucomicrobiae bacterium]|nr:hypothetical protein [Verrucomicrobiae bacterium]